MGSLMPGFCEFHFALLPFRSPRPDFYLLFVGSLVGAGELDRRAGAISRAGMGRGSTERDWGR